MSRARSLVLLAAAAALGACASDPPRALVNVAFTISTDASAYRTFAFDLGASAGPDVEGVEQEAVQRAFVDAAADSLTALGYERAEAGSADLLVSYEFWVEDGGDESARTRGSIVVTDARSGDFLWRATRKATLGGAEQRLSLDEGMRRFVEDMLRYVTEISRATGGR